MRFALLLLILAITSCAAAPSYQFHLGGETIHQPGVSFVLPKGKPWAAVIRSTYQAAFGAGQMPKDDTLIVAVQVYNTPPFTNRLEFLEAVKNGRAAEPQTGRFERIRNSEAISEGRSETCVVHQSASKDFGVEAKRGGEYSILETFGMNCVHPLRPQVGVLVELSRKAPPGTSLPEFEAMAQGLLSSVSFGEF
jgi:hypothetical protein